MQLQGYPVKKVKKRLQSFGRNELEVKKERKFIEKVIGQLEDPMIIVLLIAAFFLMFPAVLKTGSIPSLFC